MGFLLLHCELHLGKHHILLLHPKDLAPWLVQSRWMLSSERVSWCNYHDGMLIKVLMTELEKEDEVVEENLSIWNDKIKMQKDLTTLE